MSSSRPDSEATVHLPEQSPAVSSPAAADQTIALPGSELADRPGSDTAYLPPPASPAAHDATLVHVESGTDLQATLLPGELPVSPDTAHNQQETLGGWEHAGGVQVPGVASQGIPPWEASSSAASKFPLLPGYEILGELGRGAMGVVYKARQVGLKRLVALKMILAGGQASSTEILRFRTEAEAVARLQHPNIVQVFEIGEHQGLPYFSLEFVEGGCLADRLGVTTLPVHEAAQIVAKLADGMAFAHESGIVHRDLKPANILLTREGEPKITDFGLAKKLEEDSSATRAGTIMGTPSYMAPEQAEGRNDLVGPLSDVYALGAILYDLLTGRPPFKGATLLETLTQIRTTDPVSPARLDPKMPRDLETICLKCLLKEPKKRYQSARELAADLRRFLAGEPIQARPVSTLERTWKWCRRHPAAAGLIAMSGFSILLMAFGGLAYAQLESRRADQALHLMEQAEKERARAEKHFSQAREAVDQMLLRVGQERLAYEPRMEQIRRDLLEKAAVFYERFLEVDDPSAVVRHEAALAAIKVGDIRAYLGDDEKAQAAYRRAQEMLEPLVQEHPETLDYRHDLASVTHNRATLFRRSRDYAEADALLSRAIQLQQTLVDEEPTPSRRAELARFYYNRGRLDEDRGESQAALLSYRTARGLQQALIDEFPSEAVYREELAQTWMNLARVQGIHQPGDAERSLQQAIELLDALLREMPTSPSVRQSLVLASLQLGDRLRVKRSNEALPLYRRAVLLGESLVRDFPTVPDYQQQLAAASNSLGVWYLAAGNRDQARSALRRSLTLKERLATNFPRLPDYQRDYSRSLGNVGLALQTAGQGSEAASYYTRAVEQIRQMIREFPGSQADEQELALALTREASLDLPRAEKPLREALAIQDRLLERNPRSLEYRSEWAQTCAALAMAQLLAGNVREAGLLFDRAEKVIRAQVASGADDPNHRFDLALLLINRGEYLRMLNRLVEAERSWAEANTLLGELVKGYPDRPRYRAELARALHNLGVVQAARDRAADAETSHQAALALRQRLIEELPDELVHRQDLARSHAELAIAKALRNNHASSENHFKKALAILAECRKVQPADLNLLREEATQEDNFARLLGALGREDDAIAHWKRRLTLLGSLPATSAGNLATQAQAQLELALQLNQFGRKSEARVQFRQGLTLQRQAIKQAPGEVTYRAALGNQSLVCVEFLLSEKDHAGAAQVIAEALPDLPRDWPQYPIAAASLSRCVALAEGDTSLPEKKRKELAEAYGKQAVELLNLARGGGFQDIAALRKAREFDPIRTRPDFLRFLEGPKK
ncbi:MAG: protein kinase [Gemmataceae bacterium]